MRIVFFVNYDIESSMALNLLWPHFKQHFAGIFYSQKVGSDKPRPASLLDDLAFVEQVVFPSLIFQNAERSPANGFFLGFYEMARYFEGPFARIDNVNEPATLEKLRALKPDLFVSIRFGKIFGEEALAIPRLGVLNLHSGLLPQYRGVLATFRAMMNGDEEHGCTLHWIDSPKIDKGEILATAKRKVHPKQTLLRQISALYPLGVRLLIEAIQKLMKGEKLVGQPQDPAAGAYYSFPSDAEVLEFLSRGWRIWNEDDILDLASSYGCGKPVHGEIALGREWSES